MSSFWSFRKRDTILRGFRIIWWRRKCQHPSSLFWMQWNVFPYPLMNVDVGFTNDSHYTPRAASWCKRLAARLPPLGSRVRISVPPCGFRGGRNEVRVGFSRFPLPQISFHHFSTLISSISLHFVCPCDGATGMVGRQPCYSLTYNIGASSHLIPQPDLVLDTSWGYFIITPTRASFHLSTISNLMFVKLVGSPLLLFQPMAYVHSWFMKRRHLDADTKSKRRRSEDYSSHELMSIWNLL